MSTPKERGTLIAVWLLLLLVVNLFVLLFYLALAIYPSTFSLLTAIMPLWTLYLFAALAAFNVVCVCFLFLWKKWAFFGLCGSTAAALAANLYIGAGPYAVSGVFGVVITYLVIHDKWNLFDDFYLI